MEKRYRELTAAEVASLKDLGNRAEDWTKVHVSDTFNTECIYNCSFGGEVYLGVMEQGKRLNGSLPLAEGLSNSMIYDSTIGDHCAIHNVRLLSGYTIGDNSVLFNIDEMTADNSDDADYAWIEPMNENGGRRILPFNGMTIGDAYMWARFRGQTLMMERLEEITRKELAGVQGRYGTVGDSCVIKNTKCLHNVAVNSTADDPSRIEECIMLSDGVVGFGCKLEYGIIAQRFLLGEHVHLEYGLRLNDSVVGDNSTLARCEVGCSIIFPAHEQHHNNSFLIAALVMGQSNIAAGGTLGSNHNSRTADNEISCGRGFWPGLCVSLKHSSRFASNCLLAKGDYPAELNITLPFALVNNNMSKDRLEVMPAYWWMYNMYAMDRNSKKFAARDKRHYKAQHIEFDNLAPDTAEEIIIGRDLLKMWTDEAYREGKTEIEAHGMEKGKRKTVILKAGDGYKAYYDMLVYYAMNVLCAEGDSLPDSSMGEGERVTRWVNIGGQLISEKDMKSLIADIENGTLTSWDAIHGRFDALWKAYPEAKRRHAYQVLCHLSQKKSLDATEWEGYKSQYQRIKQYVADQKVLSRKKDETNEFRRMTYWNDAEMQAVLG
ncbi:MAG: DUF4954 family protein [Bacteroidales bacterium]|nr:DUF4954 family protein [Bacteroidales bacterium]